MNIKSKANFINAVAGGQKIPCPTCNTLNKSDALFCISCGTKLPVNRAKGNKEETMDLKEDRLQGSQRIIHEPVKGVRSMYLEEMIPDYFRLYSKEPVSTGESDNSVRKNLQTVSENKRQAFRPVVSADSAEEGQISVFAQGLPAWDVVPPQIMVRRKMGR